jgi:hypothetical protein
MTVRGTVTEITHNVKGVAKTGKEYQYTKFVYTTETGESKIKQIFKPELIEGVKVGDVVDLHFEKNQRGFYDLMKVTAAGASPNIPTAKTGSAGPAFGDKDVEIEVMNALNVASNLEHVKDTETLVCAVKCILDHKKALVEYAKDARTGKTKCTGTDSENPFEGVS